MGVNHSSGEKPKKLYENLGLDVKLETKQLENDAWAQNTVKEVGKTMAEPGFTYLGSVVVHYYRTGENDLLGRNQVAMKQQIAIGSLNEYITLLGVQNLTIALRKHFGRGYRTTDKNDKRGEG